MWLDLVCEYWLSYKGDNVQRAMYDEPTFDLPKSFPIAERFNRARKECGAWAPYPKRKSETPQSEASRWEWPVVFEYWHSGGMRRGVDALLECIPEESRVKVLKELNK